MPLRRLDHVNLRTADLPRLIDFYTRVLGLEEGPRPNFGFPGAWLYCEGEPIVHLVGLEEAPAPYRRDQQLEHFAIAADDKNGLIQVLEAEGIPYRPVEITDFGITQININDPDGNHLHIDFRE